MDAFGTSSYSNSSRFPINMPANTVTPVTFPRSVNAVDEAVPDRLIAAGEDDWNRRGRWREALKDGLIGSLRSKALALNDCNTSKGGKNENVTSSLVLVRTHFCPVRMAGMVLWVGD